VEPGAAWNNLEMCWSLELGAAAVGHVETWTKRARMLHTRDSFYIERPFSEDSTDTLKGKRMTH
jgi:hypothetical protein